MALGMAVTSALSGSDNAGVGRAMPAVTNQAVSDA